MREALEVLSRDVRLLREAVGEPRPARRRVGREALGSQNTRSGPQHDCLVARFEQAKARIEAVVQEFMTRRGAAGTGRSRAVAELKAALLERVVACDAGLVGFLDGEDPAESDLDRRELFEAVAALQSVRVAIAEARPPGRLLVPTAGEPFDPSQHRAVRGCEDAGSVSRVVFPGYTIESTPRRVVLKADVTTSGDRPD